jgi:galactofuranosylgalactofuranosylrhamnosyl-N-acetylglucosaminyl-diphospho-decaprenol beta-1,5/1,6-galactofuranosyltransferase
VEFGYRLLRAGVPTVFLPGVAVWHESFELKGRGWQPFYELRNLLILGALHFPMTSAAPLARQLLSRLLDELLIYDYYEAWLLCEAVAAYLRGPTGLRTAPQLVHRRLLAAGEQLASRTQPRDSNLKVETAARPPSGLFWIRVRRLWLVLRNVVLSSPPRTAKPCRAVRADGEQWYTVSGADVLAVDETSREDLVVLRRSRGRFVQLLLRGLWLALRLFGSHRRAARRWQTEAPPLTTSPFWGEYLGLTDGMEMVSLQAGSVNDEVLPVADAPGW